MQSPQTQDREIERKYLLNGLPDRVREARSLDVEQGYLPGTRINERVRRMTAADGTVTFVRTIKAGAGLERLEVEEPTTREFFEAVWPLTRGCRCAKRRH